MTSASSAMASDADKQQEGGNDTSTTKAPTKEKTRENERPTRCMSAYGKLGSLMLHMHFYIM